MVASSRSSSSLHTESFPPCCCFCNAVGFPSSTIAALRLLDFPPIAALSPFLLVESATSTSRDGDAVEATVAKVGVAVWQETELPTAGEDVAVVLRG